ncbi:head-tail adaptor protein [Pseudophaeobacter arcticus]|jgi:head-tail adaptor|uniref:head-tail adaptor protein n=1 Tax=Pseudophaeobacter arcticus TaxID=385492 RepID=UPI0039E4B445
MSRKPRSKSDVRIQFAQLQLVDDGLQRVEKPVAVGHPVRAQRTDVSDGEKFRSGQDAAWKMARFVVRLNRFTATLTPSHRLMLGEQDFEIIGIKGVENQRRWLEITAVVKVQP